MKNNEELLSGLFEADFNKVLHGKQVSLFVLTNEKGAELAITNYGARIVSLMVPDRWGNAVDVVLGHESIDDYLHTEEPYFGAICGRYANRIANGRFALGNDIYQLPVNNGPNCLHGGIRGFNAVVWEAEQDGPQTLTLRYTAADGEEGFPGELQVAVTYHLTDENDVVISYHATTNKATVLNLTNHSYFNLSGAGDPSIGDHQLMINADTYLPTDETSIPYGEPEPVEGTPMDFRTAQEVGARINQRFQQLCFGRGYDHTYILKDGENGLRFCARCLSPKTGIVMEVITTEPGVQLYTGNWMTGNCRGKHGYYYPSRSALCLETQHFPDSPNHREYPSTVLRPGETFMSTTIYSFSVE